MNKFLNIGVIGLALAGISSGVLAAEVVTDNATRPAASKAKVHVVAARTADARVHARSTHAPVTHAQTAPTAVNDQESLDANHFSAAGEGEFMPSSRLHHPH